MNEDHLVSFNVGGSHILATASLSKFLETHPKAPLSQLVRAHTAAHPNDPPPLFLDHNPFAFNVILDYFRYGKLHIPASVSKDVVFRLFQEFGIPFPSDEQPPSYGEAVQSSIKSIQNYTAAQASTSSDTVAKSGNEAARRLEPLFNRIQHIVHQYAQKGYSQLRIIISSHDVQIGQVAESLEEIEHSRPSSTPLASKIPMQLICINAENDWSKAEEMMETRMPDMKYLLQHSVFEMFARLLTTRSGWTCACVDTRDVMVRTTNEFGLLQSRSTPIVFATLFIPLLIHEK